MTAAKWDWHEYAIDLAHRGFRYSEIYDWICQRYDRMGVAPPKRDTVTNYLWKHRPEWRPVVIDHRTLDSAMRQSREFRNLQRTIIRAAKELMYDPEYILKLQKATTEAELSRIMLTARQRSCEEDMEK